MPDRLTRRRWIALGGSAIVAGIAGCTSDDGDDGGDDGGSDDGSDGGADGGTEDGSDGGTDGGAATFGDSLAYPESYAFTITAESAGGVTTFDGRFYQGDVYYEAIFEDSQNVEFYTVGDESYFVTGDLCFKNPDESQDPTTMDPENFLNREELEAKAEENPYVEPVETTTIDGDEVRVYELGSEADLTLRYYILTDSGFPRRIAWEGSQIDLTDHNNVQPISAPDMDCQEM